MLEAPSPSHAGAIGDMVQSGCTHHANEFEDEVQVVKESPPRQNQPWGPEAPGVAQTLLMWNNIDLLPERRRNQKRSQDANYAAPSSVDTVQ